MSGSDDAAAPGSSASDGVIAVVPGLPARVAAVAAPIIAVVLGFALLAYETGTVLFLIFFAYGLSGPLAALFRLYRRRGRRHAAESRRL